MHDFLRLAIIFACAVFSGSTSALPTSKRNANAIVYIRLIGDSGQHYSIGDIQRPASEIGNQIPILVGQTLDFAHSTAPHIQELDIARIAAGSSLKGLNIEEDDSGVRCKATINSSSSGPTFSVKDQHVSLDEGRIVSLSSVACWVEDRL